MLEANRCKGWIIDRYMKILRSGSGRKRMDLGRTSRSRTDKVRRAVCGGREIDIQRSTFMRFQFLSNHRPILKLIHSPCVHVKQKHAHHTKSWTSLT